MRFNPANKYYGARNIGIKVKLTRLQVYIARQDIIENYVLDKVAAVVFFIIIKLDVCKGNS